MTTKSALFVVAAIIIIIGAATYVATTSNTAPSQQNTTQSSNIEQQSQGQLDEVDSQVDQTTSVGETITQRERRTDELTENDPLNIELSEALNIHFNQSEKPRGVYYISVKEVNNFGLYATAGRGEPGTGFQFVAQKTTNGYEILETSQESFFCENVDPIQISTESLPRCFLDNNTLVNR